MILRLERCGMKFAHIGDLHIGKRVHDFSMLEDQRYIMDQMMKIFAEQKVDGVLIAGDVYDKTVPSAEAVQLFDEFITGLAKAEIPVPFCSGFLLFLPVSEKRSDKPSFCFLLSFPDPDTVSADLLFSVSAANVRPGCSL